MTTQKQLALSAGDKSNGSAGTAAADVGVNFIGGFSAATAMIIVESVALSTMVMNSFVMPTLWDLSAIKNFHAVVLNIKRLVILGCVFLGYTFALYVGEFYSLVDIGLKSFEAVTIFAPSILIGLYWKGGNKKGAMAGIIAGFSVWIYTLLIPALMRAGIIEAGGVMEGVFNSTLLKPTALFGLEGLDRWSHSLFWGLFLNIGFYVGVSIFTRQSDAETHQAIVFVDSFSPLPLTPAHHPANIAEVEDVLGQYIGPTEAREAVDVFLKKHRLSRESIRGEWLLKLRQEAERILSGSLGTSISTLVFQDRTVLTHDDALRVSDSIQQISRSLRLSRQELAEANRQLAMLKEFSENIIESLPLGVATLDEGLSVKYWNTGMEMITGVEKSDALDTDASDLLTCLEPRLFTPQIHEGEITCRRNFDPQIVLKGYVSRLTGAQKGFVLVLEDITEKKKIEEELFRATKHASVGRLAAGVAHEIGNPLASISSLVQELQTEDLTTFTKESLTTINQHVHRIARIVRNLGDFARLYPRGELVAFITSAPTLALVLEGEGAIGVVRSTMGATNPAESAPGTIRIESFAKKSDCHIILKVSHGPHDATPQQGPVGPMNDVRQPPQRMQSATIDRIPADARKTLLKSIAAISKMSRAAQRRILPAVAAQTQARLTRVNSVRQQKRKERTSMLKSLARMAKPTAIIFVAVLIGIAGVVDLLDIIKEPIAEIPFIGWLVNALLGVIKAVAIGVPTFFMARKVQRISKATAKVVAYGEALTRSFPSMRTSPAARRPRPRLSMALRWLWESSGRN